MLAAAFNEFVVSVKVFSINLDFLEAFSGIFDCWKDIIVRIKCGNKWQDLSFSLAHKTSVGICWLF